MNNPEIPEAQMVNEAIPKKITAGRKRIYPWDTWLERLAEEPGSKIKMTFATEELAGKFSRNQSTARPLGLRLTLRGKVVYITSRKPKE